MIGSVLQELIKQIAVGSVQLYAIEARRLSVLCPTAKGLDNAFDLVGFESARRHEGSLWTQKADSAGRGNGTWGDR